MSYYKLNIEKIRSLALAKGMSMSGLCLYAGMDRSRATEWKHHNVMPQTVYRIARVLGVEDPRELIVDEKLSEVK